ncbi:hypothetical protein N2152v2_005694 [Parachlorella kessleri]
MEAPLDAEDVKMETDNQAAELQGKAQEIDHAKIESDVAALRQLAKQGKAQEAVDGLLNIEKQQRVAEDVVGTKMACTAILEIYFEARDWKQVQEYVQLLSKRRGQLKQAVQSMVRQAMGYIPQTPDQATRVELIKTLQTLTEGKIYVEIERARLTKQLAKMKEEEGNIQEAAEILQEVPVETFGAMAKSEKVAYILEQVRLCLDRKDFVRAQILSKKISPRAFAEQKKKGEQEGEIGIEGTAIEAPEEGTPSLEELKLQYYAAMIRYYASMRYSLGTPSLEELKLQYYAAMIRYYSHMHDYLEICRCYRAVYETPSVQQDAGRWKEVLQKICWYVVLAPTDSHQITLLTNTLADKRLDELKPYKELLQQFDNKEVVWWSAISGQYAGEMDAHADIFAGEDGQRRRDDFKLRVIEHNILVVSKYYRRITMQRLGQILDLTQDEAEKQLSEMVVGKALEAKIDRPAGVVRFSHRAGPVEALNKWSRSIAKLLETVEKTCQQIQKESMIHKDSAKKGKADARPKSAKGAGSKPGTASAAAAAEAANNELAKKLEQLDKEKQKEEQSRNLLQLERDKITSFWDITKRDLDDKRAELRIKDRDMEELQDKHAVELKVYRQKVKHLLYEHQNHIAKLKADAEVALKQQQDSFARQEAELADDKRRLRQHIKEQELSGVELLKQFRLENAKEARQIQQKYEAQLKELQEALEMRYASEVYEVEESKNAHIQNLMLTHEKAFRDMKAYYNEITHANLDLIKTLKEEIAELKRSEVKNEKLMHDVARENKRLTEPLSKAVQEVESLRQAVATAERNRGMLESTKSRLVTSEKRCRALEWENEVLQQRLDVVQRERDDLAARFQAAVMQVQQRSSLKAVVLEKKIEALGGELNRRDTQLAAALQNPLSPSKRPSLAGRGSGSRAQSAVPSTAAATGRRTTAGGSVPPGSREATAALPGVTANSPALGNTAAHPADIGAAPSLDSLLSTALNTPLPDQDMDILEDDLPGTILQHLAELQAKEAAAGTGLGALSRLESKLALAAAAAENAAAGAIGASMIPAVHSQMGVA